ncbi:MAG TPA: type II secretion system protein [Gammaproteobacteria bacterium]|nr:type II secretion system protein [Gammaproteobacteria bacterium]
MRRTSTTPGSGVWPRGRLSGFTLTELVTVLVIVGIVAAFAGPRFFTTSPFAERGFYEDSLAALRYAQKFAIASRCTSVTATFTAGTGPPAGYALTYAGCPGAGSVLRPSGGNFSNTAPTGVAVTAASISFDDMGRTPATTTVTIGSRTITVEKETGFVH